MLSSLQFLLIGDIHYPRNKDESFGDIKDTLQSTLTRSQLGNTKLMALRKCLMERMNETEYDSILVTGDLSEKGSSSGYVEGVEYLLKSLESITGTVLEEVLHVVPGNHDIQRLVEPTNVEQAKKKFDIIIDTWTSKRLSVATVDKMRARSYSNKDGCRVDVISLNSCVGCGELRELHPETKRIVLDYISKAGSGLSDADKGKLLHETLDTPMFWQEDRAGIATTINNLPNDSLPIILAHHNLLPQTTPRTPATELLDGGHMRLQLHEPKRSVIYCHGHTHEHSIEAVVSELSWPWKTILIGCPELTEGFNEIVVQYSRKKYPIGCIVNRYRSTGKVKYEFHSSVRIPLLEMSNYKERIDPAIFKLTQLLDNKPRRFSQIKVLIEDDTMFSGYSDEELASLFLEAEWFGILEIRNREDRFEDWQLEKLTP